MAYEYLTMVASFITCFMMGVTLSLQPASIIVGAHTHLREQSKWTRWNGYIMFVLLLFVLDMLVTNGIYIAFHDVYGNLLNIVYHDFNPMDMFFSESFQIVVILVFSLVLFQVLGLVDLAHGERDLSFYYDQVDEGKTEVILDGAVHGESKRLSWSELGGFALYAENDDKNNVALYRVPSVV